MEKNQSPFSLTRRTRDAGGNRHDHYQQFQGIHFVASGSLRVLFTSAALERALAHRSIPAHMIKALPSIAGRSQVSPTTLRPGPKERRRLRPIRNNAARSPASLGRNDISIALVSKVPFHVHRGGTRERRTNRSWGCNDNYFLPVMQLSHARHDNFRSLSSALALIGARASHGGPRRSGLGNGWTDTGFFTKSRWLTRKRSHLSNRYLTHDISSIQIIDKYLKWIYCDFYVRFLCTV